MLGKVFSCRPLMMYWKPGSFCAHTIANLAFSGTSLVCVPNHVMLPGRSFIPPTIYPPTTEKARELALFIAPEPLPSVRQSVSDMPVLFPVTLKPQLLNRDSQPMNDMSLTNCAPA